MHSHRHSSRLLLAALLAVAATALGAAPAGAAEEEACANHAPREQQKSLYLPECRGFELVSPVFKNSQEVQVPEENDTEAPYYVAGQDRTVAYTLTGGIPGAESAGLWQMAVSTSTAPASPWNTLPVSPESRFGVVPGRGPRSTGEYVYLDPTLSCGILRTRLAQAESPESSEPLLAEGETREEAEKKTPAQLYVVNFLTGKKTMITSVKTENPDLSFPTSAYYVNGVSANCEHVLYENQNPGYNLKGAPQTSQYEWDMASGKPSVASVLPDGSVAQSVEAVRQGEQGGKSNVGIVSEDGKRAFFTAVSDGKGPGESLDAGAAQLYVRENTENGMTTTDLSRWRGTTAVRDSGAVFQGATADGSKAFFLASYGLTDNSSKGTAAPTGCTAPRKGINGTGCDLYEYDFASATLNDLSADIETTAHKDSKGANVRGVIGWSRDGSYVYFSAAGQLVEGQGKTGEENEVAKEASVYALHAGHLSYVTNIDEVEAGGGNGGELFGEVDALVNAGGVGPHYEQAKVSPNGQYLLLATRKQITGYNNVDAAEPAASDPEFYEYHYSAGPTTPGANLTCVSCKPNGKQPEMVQPATFNPDGPYTPNYAGVLRRTLLDDGRVFFQSTDPLVAQGRRAEGVKQALDVYEFRPLGVSGCETATQSAPGCVNILDSGADTFPTYLVGASLSGNDVYLTTHAALVPQDGDGSRDMYDVRTLGGSVAAASNTNCEAGKGVCQGAYIPRGGSPHGSEGNLGNGNLPPNTAPKVEVEPNKEVKLSLGHRSTKKGVLTVTLNAPAAGRLTLAGSGLKGASKTAAAAGSYTLKVTLGAKGRAALKHHKRVRAKVRASFAPTAGKASSVTFTVTFR